MAKPYARYAKEIRDRLHYGATWTPGTPLKLGQVGTFENGVFVPKSNLGALGIKRFELEADSKATSYTYSSSSGVSLNFKAKGASSQTFKSLAEAEAGVAISFTRENAVVFGVSDRYEHRIADVVTRSASAHCS